MRTLVVNLTRFGDLLQTQPVFSALRQGGAEVGLVCLENFAPAAALVRGVKRVFPVPGAGLLARLDRNWPEALGLFLDWTDDLRRRFAPERVVCLTSSLPARLLARAFAGEEPVTGFGLDQFGYGLHSSPWAAFLEATALHRGASPFNLVDIFFKAAHLGDGPRDARLAEPGREAVEAAERLIGQSCPDLDLKRTPGRRLIGLQLGASAAKRQWPVESFAELARHAWDVHGLLPVLLGSADERPLAERFASLCPAPRADLTGATDLPLLAGAVSLLDLLVTNDTGTMHLAAGLGVPVMAMFLATAQPWDTGPYLPGCCCLEADIPCHPCHFSHVCQIGYACHRAIRAQTARTLLDGWLDSGRWPETPGQGARVWESQAGEEGFLDLRSLSGHEGHERTVWYRVQRRLLRRFLDGLPPDFIGLEASALPEEARRELQDTLGQAGGLLEVLLQQARVLGSVPHPTMRARFMATWQRLESLFSADRRLSSLGHLWACASQGGADMAHFTGLAERTLLTVRALSSLLDASRQ